MPKHIIEFNLPEESEELKTTFKASSMHCALSDIGNVYRSKLKYENLSDTEYKIYEEMREKFWEILKEYEIDL